MRIAWEIHLGRLQQQQQKQHGGIVDQDERRPATSSGSDSRYGDRPSENGRCKVQGDAVLLRLFFLSGEFLYMNRNTKLQARFTDVECKAKYRTKK